MKNPFKQIEGGKCIQLGLSPWLKEEDEGMMVIEYNMKDDLRTDARIQCARLIYPPRGEEREEEEEERRRKERERLAPVAPPFF